MLVRLAALRTRSTYIELEYPPAARNEPRYGWGKPPHAGLWEILSLGNAQYGDSLRDLLSFKDDLLKIGAAPTATEPGWKQFPQWLFGLDGVSLYGFLRLLSPRQYVEIGSGTSTKFIARARRDGGLNTRITSIDPHPRAEIDALCDEVIRAPLESADLTIFRQLQEDDIVFFDGSHRAFMNSDVVVFFLDVLPSLPAGVLVGVHDIYLPYDYPRNFAERYFSEQYLLACYLLAHSGVMSPVLPCYYVGWEPGLRGILDPLWREERMREVETYGVTYWFRTRAPVR